LIFNLKGIYNIIYEIIKKIKVGEKLIVPREEVKTRKSIKAKKEK
jgi:hypothetical protein